MTFIRNEYGLWCPNCQERIDEMWPDSCDACGYPRPDHDRFDDGGDFDDRVEPRNIDAPDGGEG